MFPTDVRSRTCQGTYKNFLFWSLQKPQLNPNHNRYRSPHSYIMLPPMNLSIVRLLPKGPCGNYGRPPNIPSCIGPCRPHGLRVANRTRRSEPRPEAERRATTEDQSRSTDNLLRSCLHLGSRTGYLSGIYSAHRRV